MKIENKNIQSATPGPTRNTISEERVSLSILWLRHRFTFSLFLITLITILVYSNTFSSSFHLDDINSIVENDRIQDLSNFLNFSGTRYIGNLSFALNYHFGGLNVFGYHLVNIIIHILNGILVWWFVILTFKTPLLEKVAANSLSNSLIALASSLFFVAHPIQTQAVTYIVQRQASLATLFYLLSIVLFIRWRLSSGSGLRWGFYFFSILSAIFAMKTKEISFTLPLVIVLYEFTFFRYKLKRAYYLVPFLLTLLIIPLTMIGIAKPLGDMVGELSGAAQETASISRGTYLLTQFRVVVTYIRLLLFPVNQNLDYAYPIYRSFFIPGVFLSFLFLLLIAALAVYLYMRSRKEGNGYFLLVSFGIFWFFITLSVESSIIPIRDVIFEHRLYLPGVGAVMAISSAVLYGFRDRMKWGGICLLIAVVILSLATYQRNRVWRDEVTLWEDVVSKSPFKARPHYNLGVAYDGIGRRGKAIKEYKTTLRLNPNYVDAHYNLGNIYLKHGLLDKAVEKYLVALQLYPDHAEGHANLGGAYAQQGRYNEAVEELRIAIRLRPGNAEARNSLGISYIQIGRINEAIEEIKAAIRLKPDNAEIRNNLGLIYTGEGRINEAIGEFNAALMLKPDYVEARNNLEIAYKKIDQKKGRDR